jgi:hypothetical protein
MFPITKGGDTSFIFDLSDIDIFCPVEEDTTP